MVIDIKALQLDKCSDRQLAKLQAQVRAARLKLHKGCKACIGEAWYHDQECKHYVLTL